MISVIQNNDVYQIRFPYDPNLVAYIKNVPGRVWNPNAKMWTIPLNRLGFFINQVKGTNYESQLQLASGEMIGVNATIDTNDNIPDIDISDIKQYVETGCHLFQHQIDFLKYAKYRDTQKLMSGFILADEPGAGKALSLDTKIYTPSGYKLMKDIQVGDTVFNEQGKPVQVLATYDHESLNMYNVTFTDGKSIVCCEDHLWTIFDHKSNKITCTLSQIIDGSWRYQKNRHNYNYQVLRIPRCLPVEFEAKEVPIDPYVLGALLGNGSMSCPKGAIGFSTADVETAERINQLLPDDYIMHTTPSRKPFEYTIVNKFGRLGRNHPNYIRKSLESLGLLGRTSHTKFIPDVYKYNTPEIRLSVLQGLIDTDGYVGKTNYVEYTTVSTQLKDDVVFLVESLGGVTWESFKKSTKSWNVTIKCDDPTILCRLTRKQSKLSKRKFTPKRRFQNIEYIGKLPGKCITVSGESKLYLCDHFIVTHNTLEFTNLALYHRQKYGYKHCLIICCVNTAKYNWVDDIIKHTNGEERPYILGSRIKRNGEINYLTGNAERLEDLKTGRMYGDKKGTKLPYFLIVNIEALRYRVPKSKVYPIAKALMDMIDSGNLNMIGIDEIHKNCSPSSKQGQQLLNIKKHTGSKVYWMPITGTPIVNKPTDVFTPLKLVDGHAYSSFYMWCQKYCIYGGFGGHEIVAYKNIPELKELVQKNMLRRLKADFIDLPEKMYYTDYVENTKYQEKWYNIILNEIQNDRLAVMSAINPIAKFIRLRQVNGSPELIDKECQVDSKYIQNNAKLQKLMELLADCAERNEKVLVYSNWVEPLRTIYKHISKQYKVCCYTGTMTERDRQINKQRFMEDPTYQVMIGTIGAMGTSHTLTAANHVIFYDEPWTPTDREQAIDRVHRPGATKTIHIHTIITKDTVDEKVHNILYTKEGISKYILDNELDFKNNPDLFDMLLK